VQVEIAPVPEKAGHIRLVFTNESGAVQWLARPRAVVGEKPESGFLEFDQPARYVGLRAKRGPYIEEELVAVPPGDAVQSDLIHLTDYYRLPEASEVRVRYASSHPLPGLSAAAGPFDRLESAWVTVTL
jgi:hypothetical protein